MSMTRKNRITGLFRVILFLAAVSVMAVSLTNAAYIIYHKYKVYDVREIEARFKVGEGIGLSADSDILNFGMVGPESSSTKEIVLYHEYSGPLLVKITYTGNISEVLLPVKDFYLEPNGYRKVGITAYAKPGSSGEYSGTVMIMYFRT
jgi:hypothetical protein